MLKCLVNSAIQKNIFQKTRKSLMKTWIFVLKKKNEKTNKKKMSNMRSDLIKRLNVDFWIGFGEFIFPKILSDILKYALLNFYDVVKLEHQLLDYASGSRVHPDLNPWNFIVTESSDLVPIDEEGASLFGRGAEASKKLSWGLMNLIY